MSVANTALPEVELPRHVDHTDLLITIGLAQEGADWWAIRAVSIQGAPWQSSTVRASAKVAALIERLRSGGTLPPRGIRRSTWAELSHFLLPGIPQRAEPWRLALSADPRLWQIPWAAIIMSRGQQLADIAVLRLIPSLRTATALSAVPLADLASLPAAALLDPGLAGHTEEVRALQEWRGGYHPLREWPAPRRPPIDSAYGLGYLAGHAPGPEAAVRVADGIVAVETLARGPLPPLMFLNGCWTGATNSGFGRDPLSLGVACLIGGSSYVIASVGPIGSAPSALIAAKLLRTLGKQPSVAHALRRAQLMLRDERPELGVMEWAGLVAIGAG